MRDHKKIPNKNLKLFRLAQDFQQDELAKKIGISQQKLSRIERGAQKPTEDVAAKIAIVLGVEVSTLFAEVVRWPRGESKARLAGTSGQWPNFSEYLKNPFGLA
jgi:transcriptional regulator with XRE-family HTH domain